MDAVRCTNAVTLAKGPSFQSSCLSSCTCTSSTRFLFCRSGAFSRAAAGSVLHRHTTRMPCSRQMQTGQRVRRHSGMHLRGLLQARPVVVQHYAAVWRHVNTCCWRCKRYSCRHGPAGLRHPGVLAAQALQRRSNGLQCGLSAGSSRVQLLTLEMHASTSACGTFRIS